MNNIYRKVAEVLRFIVNDSAEELWGKSSGFIVRQRKLTGYGFIKMVLFS